MHIDGFSLFVGFVFGYVLAIAGIAWFTIHEDRAADDEDVG